MAFAMPSASHFQGGNASAMLQVVDYEQTKHQFDPTAAPEKQAKIALDAAIASGDTAQLQTILNQIAQLLPQTAATLMMHAMRSAGKKTELCTIQFLLDQVKDCSPQQIFEFMKYALDGAAEQNSPSMMDFVLGAIQRSFHTSYPQQILELVQYALNAVAKQGNLGLLKFLMDHTASVAIPINYDVVFHEAVTAGKAEHLLREAIKAGALYENVILMLLQSIKNLPNNSESCVGSRQSLKNTAKLQLVRSYKRTDPTLFAKLMTAVRAYFPEDTNGTEGVADSDDVAM
eukprot:TRINITY_DN28637_c0_g1_i1.p1 TRINITY_DN28637_c0_g1~~TRINITY_DN28637_c0_g1_i1.p1  ORF type:complete len:288 (-),score=48.85 TRINITY_DN28637_c0_g1_i1:110-973(-)